MNARPPCDRDAFRLLGKAHLRGSAHRQNSVCPPTGGWTAHKAAMRAQVLAWNELSVCHSRFCQLELGSLLCLPQTCSRD